MFTEKEKDLARKAAKLTGSIVGVIPVDAVKRKAYLDLIAEELQVVAATASENNVKPLKAISDNLTDTLHAIYEVLPVAVEDSKRRAMQRFKSSIGIMEGILNMIGL